MVLVVGCLCSDQPSLLADILSCRTALKQTMDGDVLRPATVFTPVSDPLVRPDGTVSLATRVQFVRPLYDLPFALQMLAVALGG